MTTTPTEHTQDLPCTVPRMPKVAEVTVLTKVRQAPDAPVRETAVVQVLDFYPADEIIRRTAKQWEVTC
jgi:hypothetical protein